MKKITFVKITNCPFSRKADQLVTRLKERDARYQELEIEIIAEDVEPEKAAAYQYDFVPNFWYEDGKVLEGIPYLLTIKDVLDGALNEESAEVVQERVISRGFPATMTSEMNLGY